MAMRFSLVTLIRAGKLAEECIEQSMAV